MTVPPPRLEFAAGIERLLKSDARLAKKIREIQSHPDQIGKPLRNKMKGKRRIQLGPMVLVYEFKAQENVIYFLSYTHHDHAYK